MLGSHFGAWGSGQTLPCRVLGFEQGSLRRNALVVDGDTTGNKGNFSRPLPRCPLWGGSGAFEVAVPELHWNIHCGDPVKNPIGGIPWGMVQED